MVSVAIIWVLFVVIAVFIQYLFATLGWACLACPLGSLAIIVDDDFARHFRVVSDDAIMRSSMSESVSEAEQSKP